MEALNMSKEMLMIDKNGKEIKTGDIVKIEGGYFKADNGTFLVKHSPGDPSWSGSDYSLRKCNKKGEESETKYATAFWPLMVTVSSRDKRIAAHAHNKEYATIEIIGSVKVYELIVKQDMCLNTYEYNEIATEKRYNELLTYRNTEVKIISESVNEQKAELPVSVFVDVAEPEEATTPEEPATAKTNNSTYLLNQETQKLELHFSKLEYMALSDKQKKEIKSAFLFSGKAGAWVSRSTNNHWRAEQVAKSLGLEDGGKQGERLSYAEQLTLKVEKAEHRVERMEQHAENAEKRAEGLQAEMNSYHGDIAFFTQPNINSNRGRAFTNYRNRVYTRYERGMEEYRKSEYYKERAATAQATANMKQLKDAVYLHNRIKECNATIKKLQGHVVGYEEQIYKIENGEVIKSWHIDEPLTIERLEECIQERLEKMEYEMDKLAFFENCLAVIGGIAFSKNNIKVGFIVEMKRWGKCEILSAGPVNVTYKILDGGAAGMVLTDPYAAIVEIIETKEKSEKVINPFIVGDILCKHYGMDTSNAVYKAFEVVKVTGTGVKIHPIAVEKGVPIVGKYIGEPIQKKVVKSKWSDFVGVYDDNWQLHKYEQKEMAGAV
jgi:hypothetical protein